MAISPNAPLYASGRVAEAITPGGFALGSFPIAGPNPHIDATHPAYGLSPTNTATDNDVAIGKFIAAIPSTGGVVVIPPGDYSYSQTITLNPNDYTGPVQIFAYGANLTYTGSSDAILINTNTSGLLSDGNVYQYAQEAPHFYGLHLLGNANATSAVRNYGCSFATFKDTIFENFTNVASGTANLILDARFYYWVEENHYDGLEMRNAGNGILFVSEEDNTSSGQPI
ncbi:MAG: hypothetical protein ACYC96_16885, partial [Fimbriimonadaceae bacterium]